MDLKPLQCPSCGGSVPLGEGRSCFCPFCQTAVPIPENYVIWRREKEAKLKAEERLIQLHQKLGRTPRGWEVLLSKIRGGCGCSGCLLGVLTMALGSLLLQALAGLSALGPVSWQQADPDGGGSSVALAAILLSPYLAATIGLVLALAYARRKVLTLANLQGKLVASPPILPGGPATCRACGGPLEVKPGQLCSPCYYCGSQNLVALDPSWCEQLRAGTQQSRESFAEAIAVYNDATSKARMKLACYGIFFLFLGWLFSRVFQDSQDNRWPPQGFDRFVHRQSVLTLDRSVRLKLNHPIRFDFHKTNFYVPGELQYFDGVYLLVPLNRGEKLTVNLSDQDVPAVVKIVARNDVKRIEDRERLTWRTLAGRPAEFTADKKSWYVVRIAPSREVDSASYEVLLEVEGREAVPMPPDFSGATVDGVPLNLKPTSKLAAADDSPWLKLGQAEVTLDAKGRVERVRGASFGWPAGKNADALFNTYGPGVATQVYEKKEPSGFELYWNHLYTTPDAILRVKEAKGSPVEFELSRGEKNDPTTVAKAVSHPHPSTPIPFNDFPFDRTAGFNVRGIKPGATREEAELVLGKPKMEWGRYAYYGPETVCYWNGQVRWIRGPILNQRDRSVAFTGPAQFMSDKIGKRFLRIDVSGQPAGLPSCMHRGEFFSFGDDVLVVFSDNSKIISGAVVSGALFPQKEKSKLVIENHKARVGHFTLEQGSTNLDGFFSFFGQEHLAFLFQHSSKERLLPKGLAEGTERSFQYWIWVGADRALVEFWKGKFVKVQEF